MFWGGKNCSPACLLSHLLPFSFSSWELERSRVRRLVVVPHACLRITTTHLGPDSHPSLFLIHWHPCSIFFFIHSCVSPNFLSFRNRNTHLHDSTQHELLYPLFLVQHKNLMGFFVHYPSSSSFPSERISFSSFSSLLPHNSFTDGFRAVILSSFPYAFFPLFHELLQK